MVRASSLPIVFFSFNTLANDLVAFWIHLLWEKKYFARKKSNSEYSVNIFPLILLIRSIKASMLDISFPHIKKNVIAKQRIIIFGHGVMRRLDPIRKPSIDVHACQVKCIEYNNV